MEYNIFFDYGLIFIGLIIAVMAQSYLSYSYNKCRNIKSNSNLSGLEVAKKILKANNLDNIHVVLIKGNLTDHYDSSRKVIRLSTDVYNDTSIAAISVAAHECGHALQDKEGYVFLRIRNSIVPLVNICSKVGYIAIFIGFLFSLMDLAIAGIILLLAILVFELITLPVEFNASSRAKEQLEKLGIIDTHEKEKCSTMLTAAALTYVASVITTLLQLLRLILVALSRNRD